MSFDYAAIQKMAKAQPGVRVGDLLALARQNDPFYIGTKNQMDAANWFKTMWERLGYTGGVHLRRMHYALVSQDPPVSMPMSRAGETVEVLRDGQLLDIRPSEIQPDDIVWPYVNTERAWAFLNKASKYARYLRLVAPRAIVDRRNPDAQAYADYFYDPTPRVEVQEIYRSGGFDQWAARFPALPDGLPTLAELERFPPWPGYMVSGYRGVRQYHVELWSEKTTMNDVLEPICRWYGVDLALAAGEFSITRVIEFLDRLLAAGVPGRILYISDFDPSGYGMPVSVARKIEFLIANEERYSGLDVQLEPILLTAAQVAHYNLPRVPVKDSDRRKEYWQEIHGVGQTELDALEALYPGEMTRVVEAAIKQYRDDELERRSQRVRDALAARMRMIRDDVLSRFKDETAAVEGRFADLSNRYDELRVRFDEAVAGIQDEYTAFQKELQDVCDDGELVVNPIVTALEMREGEALGEFPLPEPELPDAPDNVLFDSGRSYLEQLTFYKERRAGFPGGE